MTHHTVYISWILADPDGNALSHSINLDAHIQPIFNNTTTVNHTDPLMVAGGRHENL